MLKLQNNLQLSLFITTFAVGITVKALEQYIQNSSEKIIDKIFGY